jgi:hypothetical protein
MVSQRAGPLSSSSARGASFLASTLVVLLVACTPRVEAGAYSRATTTGTWSTPGIWSTGAVPAGGDVLIMAGINVQYNTAAALTLNSLVLDTGAVLNWNPAAAQTLTVSSRFVFGAGSSTVQLYVRSPLLAPSHYMAASELTHTAPCLPSCLWCVCAVPIPRTRWSWWVPRRSAAIVF